MLSEEMILPLNYKSIKPEVSHNNHSKDLIKNVTKPIKIKNYQEKYMWESIPCDMRSCDKISFNISLKNLPESNHQGE